MSANLRLVSLVLAAATCGALALEGNLWLQAQVSSSHPQSGKAPQIEPSHNGMPMGGRTPAAGDMNRDDDNRTLSWGEAEWSIFNHRGAGWFVLFWGLTALIAGLQWPRRTWWRFVPPMMLFGLAEFLFLRNDPDAWPVGPTGLLASLHEPEDLQHRIFLILILLMALVELLRAADRLPNFFAKFSLPILAVTSGIYLFFHQHGGPEMADMMQHMSEPAMAADPAMQRMMASMAVVVHEHLWYSIAGFALAAARILADTGRLKGRWGAALWPVFAILLGIYMTGYTE